MENLTYHNAPYYLKCQGYGWKGRFYNYWMPCYILKDMGEDRCKILVFGYRHHNDHATLRLKRIRYVPKTRLTKRL